MSGGESGVYEHLLDDLITGRIISGTRLIEPVIAEQYAVSRTPVREAFVRLESDGLIQRFGRGYRVRVGKAVDILDIYEARVVLESVAAQGAAIRHTDLELARLRLVHGESLAATDDDRSRQLHSRWHRELWAAAHNEVVTSLLEKLSHQLRVLDQGNKFPDPDNRLTNDEHGRLLDALIRRDPEEAGALAAQHMIRTRETRIAKFALLDN